MKHHSQGAGQLSSDDDVPANLPRGWGERRSDNSESGVTVALLDERSRLRLVHNTVCPTGKCLFSFGWLSRQLKLFLIREVTFH